MNNGICMKDMKTGKIVQLYDNISFTEAFSKVSELRSSQNGNWYWIGKESNHNIMQIGFDLAKGKDSTVINGEKL